MSTRSVCGRQTRVIVRRRHGYGGRLEHGRDRSTRDRLFAERRSREPWRWRDEVVAHGHRALGLRCERSHETTGQRVLCLAVSIVRKAHTSTTHTTIASLGELTLVVEDGILSGVYFPGQWTRTDPATFGERSEQRLEEVEEQLAEYFAGERSSFDCRHPPTATHSSGRSGTSSTGSSTGGQRPTASSQATSVTPRWRARSGMRSATTRSP